jgi:hypothetical protein
LYQEDALISAMFTQMSDSDISCFSILLSLMICVLNQFAFKVENCFAIVQARFWSANV